MLASTPLHIHLLGDFHLVSGETSSLSMSHVPRAQSLLVYLLLHRGIPQVRTHLAYVLWPDSTEAQAHSNLRKVLHQLRQALPFADQVLAIDRQTLSWQPRPSVSWTLDILEFEQALASAEHAEQTHMLADVRQSLKRAVLLYRGDLFPGCYEEWIFPERDRLHQQFLRATERLIVLHEEAREYEDALQVAHQLLRHEPLHEGAYRQSMRLHALRGDRAAALRTYHACAKLLDRELGTKPGEATRTLYESLMHADASSETSTSVHSAGRTTTRLIGRHTEWNAFQTVWRTAVEGHPHLLLLSGEAGIGKTRLAEEMETWVSRQGLL
ncbi:MAG TPA: BTAD domain-containing putative transcriptional regulator, partial [Ktedonobacteraceae bacterium]